MRIGILTFQNQLNYGGVLQAYALYRVLKDVRGLDVELVNWWCCSGNVDFDGEPWKHLLPLWRIPALKRSLVKMMFPWSYLGFLLRRRRTRDFLRTAVKQGRRVYRHADEFSQAPFQTYVVGSDQVWSYTSPNLPICLLEGACDTARRISYSASLGFDQLPSIHVDRFRRCLGKFDAISVREPSSCKVLEQLLDDGRRISCCVDPTLLISRRVWQEMAKARHRISSRAWEKKAFVYWLGSWDRLIEVLQGLHDAGYDFIELQCNYLQQLISEKLSTTRRLKRVIRAWNVEFAVDAGPREFVAGIAESDLVVADSYHATLFAVVFEKPARIFIRSAEGRNAMRSRIHDFAEHYRLPGMVYDRIDPDFTHLPETDYAGVWQRIDEDRKRSFRYLVDSLVGVGASFEGFPEEIV